MQHHLPKTILLSLLIMLGIIFLIPSAQLRAQNTATAASAEPGKTMSPGEVDVRVAGMSDEQVR